MVEYLHENHENKEDYNTVCNVTAKGTVQAAIFPYRMDQNSTRLIVGRCNICSFRGSTETTARMAATIPTSSNSPYGPANHKTFFSRELRFLYAFMNHAAALLVYYYIGIYLSRWPDRIRWYNFTRLEHSRSSATYKLYLYSSMLQTKRKDWPMNFVLFILFV